MATTMERRINHVPQENIAAWIENLLEELRELDSFVQVPCDRPGIAEILDEYEGLLQQLSWDGAKTFKSWLACDNCGHMMFDEREVVVSFHTYRMYARCGACGTLHSAPFKFTRKPRRESD